MTRRISSSRPMTGSSLPRRASSVRSRPYRSSAWYCSSGFSLVTRCEPRTFFSASSTASVVTPRPRSEVADAAGDLRHREQQVLGREVVVAEVAALLVRGLEQLVGVGRDLGRRGRLAVDLRERVERGVDAGPRRSSGRRRRPSSTPRTTPSGWPISALEQVLRADLGVVLITRQSLGGADGLLALAGELVGVERHAENLTGRRSDR